MKIMLMKVIMELRIGNMEDMKTALTSCIWPPRTG